MRSSSELMSTIPLQLISYSRLESLASGEVYYIFRPLEEALLKDMIKDPVLMF